jgi:hypothetical protein
MLDPEIRAKLEETYGKRLSETDQRIGEHRQNVAKAYTDRYSALADALTGTADAASKFAQAQAEGSKAKADALQLYQRSMDLAAENRGLAGNPQLVDKFRADTFNNEQAAPIDYSTLGTNVERLGGWSKPDKDGDAQPSVEAYQELQKTYQATLDYARNKIRADFEAHPDDPQRTATAVQEASTFAMQLGDAIARGTMPGMENIPADRRDAIAFEYGRKMKEYAQGSLLTVVPEAELTRYKQAEIVANKTLADYKKEVDSLGAGTKGLAEAVAGERLALQELQNTDPSDFATAFSTMQVPQDLLDERQMWLDKLNGLDTNPPNPYEAQMALIQANPYYRDVFNALGMRNHDQMAEWMATNPDAALDAFNTAHNLSKSNPGYHVEDLKAAFEENDVRGRTGLQRVGQYFVNQLTGGPGYVKTGNEPAYTPPAPAAQVSSTPPAREEGEADDAYQERLLDWAAALHTQSEKQKAKAADEQRINDALNEDPAPPNPKDLNRATRGARPPASPAEEERNLPDVTSTKSRQEAAEKVEQAASRAANVKLEPSLQVPAPASGPTGTLAAASPTPSGVSPGGVAPKPKRPAGWEAGLARTFGAA